jgi:hypothetical protein
MTDTLACFDHLRLYMVPARGQDSVEGQVDPFHVKRKITRIGVDRDVRGLRRAEKFEGCSQREGPTLDRQPIVPSKNRPIRIASVRDARDVTVAPPQSLNSRYRTFDICQQFDLVPFWEEKGIRFTTCCRARYRTNPNIAATRVR